MKKISLLTLALTVGLSLTSKASTLDELANLVSESQKRTELVELCKNMEGNFNLTLNCDDLGKSELRELLIQTIKSEKDKILQEEKEQAQQEKLSQISYFVTKLNNDRVYEDFENICNQVKHVYPNCKMPAECDDSSIKEITSKAYKCLGISEDDSESSIDFSDCGISDNHKEYWEAVKNQDYVKIKEGLESRKTHVNIENCKGISYLYVAVSNGNGRIVDLLLQYGANVNTKPSPACVAIDKNYTNKFDMMMKYGLNKNNLDCDNTRGNALIYAIKKEHDKIAQIVVQDSYDLSSHSDDLGNTALHYAAMKGNESIIKFIWNKDPSIDICQKNNDGKTAYDLLKYEDSKQRMARFLKCEY